MEFKPPGLTNTASHITSKLFANHKSNLFANTNQVIYDTETI